MMSQKGFAYRPFIVIIIVLAGFAGGMWWYTQSLEDEQVFCAADAKECPDGSFVGRAGPNCEFAACPEPVEGRDLNGEDVFKTTGTVSGRVSIGPLCPVEPCDLPTQEMYSSRILMFEPLGAGRPVDEPFETPLNADGTYEVELPEGNYSVTISDCDFLGCGTTFPKTLRVTANESQTVDIDIDTGIR